MDYQEPFLIIPEQMHNKLLNNWFRDIFKYSLTFSTKCANVFLLFNSESGIKSAKATGVPRVGHGASFAHACNIRRAKKLLATQCGHSINKRRGASRNCPSFV